MSNAMSTLANEDQSTFVEGYASCCFMLPNPNSVEDVGMPALLCKCKARGIEAFTLRQFALLSNRIL